MISPCAYKPSWWAKNGHFQTILETVATPPPAVTLSREIMDTPDGDAIALDWAMAAGVGKAPSDTLVVLTHGLCGHATRPYNLHLIGTFVQEGWDCVAWNYRGSSEDEFQNSRLCFTTSNSSMELDWVVRYALAKHHYKRVFLTGFSMGGNLVLLYLGREQAFLPEEVKGGAVFCAACDLVSCAATLNKGINRIYMKYFVHRLKKLVLRLHRQFGDSIDLKPLSSIRDFKDFDNVYTAPIMGFRSAWDYWHTASSSRYLKDIDRPVLMVQPQNDPILAGDCYPLDVALHQTNLTLELPSDGGHCAFISPQRQWWPAMRALEFLRNLL